MDGGIIESLVRVAQSGEARVAAFRKQLELLSERIRLGKRGGAAPIPIDFYELSRHLYYAAISLTDDARELRQPRKPVAVAEPKGDGAQRKVESESVGWQNLLGPYAQLYEASKPPNADVRATAQPPLCKIANEDALRKFARLESRGNGVTTPLFYASLAILVIHLNDQGLLASPRFRRMCPDDELDFPTRVREVIDEIIAGVEGRPTRQTLPAKVKAIEVPPTAPETQGHTPLREVPSP